MKNTAIVTMVLAVVAEDLSKSKIKQIPKAARRPSINFAFAVLEICYDLFDDPKVYEEFEDRFYKQIVVPWCDLNDEEE